MAVASCGGDSKSSKKPPGSGGSGGASSGGAGGTTGTSGGASGSGGSTTGGVGGSGTAGSAGGENDDDGGSGGEGGDGYDGPPIVYTSGKLDLVLVVDNSISMGDKQALLAASVPKLVERLVDPWCTDGSSAVPPELDGACPADTVREHAAVKDLHIGVISTSLGSHGGDVCSTGVDVDDKGQLIGKMRAGLTTWNDSGFLNWDPEGQATPPGTSDVSLLVDDLTAMILAVGDEGCGYEAPLESLYRFLVDPNPPASVVMTDGITVPTGTDTALLTQRAAFLRPDSVVMAVIISDENDCSILDEGQGWLIGYSTGAFHMPRATAACAVTPNSPCCRSCAIGESSPPAGCGTLASDPECSKGGTLPAAEDDLNLRCFEQKRRFGFDLLYPIERYVRGFSDSYVPNREGALVKNPLFAGGRHPSLMNLTVIAGVPWQDLAVDHEDTEALEYLSTEQLVELDRWDVILGNPVMGVAPTDPFMIESVAERSGQNPITSDPVVSSSSTDPTATINGHETAIIPNNNDLQFACIFPLTTPIDCTAPDATYCDCAANDTEYNRALCNPPEGGPAGTTQYYGKAYPGLRLLDVARRLWSQSAVGSICPRNVSDDTRDDYGYYPALGALQKRIAPLLE